MKGVPRCSLRARGGSSPCSPCSARSRACAWLRVAPVPAPSGAALALRCAPWRPGRRRTKGVPPQRRQEGLPARRRTKGLGGKKPGGGRSLADSGRSMARKRARSAVQGPQRVFRIRLPARRQTALSVSVACAARRRAGTQPPVIARLPKGRGPGAAAASCNALRNAL